MEHTSHHDSPADLHYHESEERAKHRSTSIGFTVLGLLLVVAVGFLAYQLRQRNNALVDLQARLGEANSNTTGLKGQLTQANARAADLQLQLDTASRQFNDTQAQLKAAGESGTSLQAQLDQTRADLQAQHETSKTQLAEVQAQVTKANSTAEGLRSDLAAAQKESAEVKGRLSKAMEDMANLQPAATIVNAAPVRPLPMTSEFKKGFFSSTYTLEITNTGAHPLKLSFAITGSGRTRSTDATVGGSGTYRLEGLAPGAQIVVTSDDYQPVTLTVQ